jgi:hypothetical protein
MSSMGNAEVSNAALDLALQEAEASTRKLSEAIAQLAARDRLVRELRRELENVRLTLRDRELQLAAAEEALSSKAYKVARRLGDVRGRLLS